MTAAEPATGTEPTRRLRPGVPGRPSPEGGGDRGRVRGPRRRARLRTGGDQRLRRPGARRAPSAAPGGTTVPGLRAATSPRTCTRSPSRRTRRGRGPSPGSRTSAPTWSASPAASASAARPPRHRGHRRRAGTTSAARWRVATTAGRADRRRRRRRDRAAVRAEDAGIPGLATFPGKVFHSARWDHDFDLTGKRVAMVGTGASAIQIVPALQPDVERLRALPAHPAVGDARSPTAGSAAPSRPLYRRLPAAQRAAGRSSARSGSPGCRASSSGRG